MRIGSSCWHSKRVQLKNEEVSKYGKPMKYTLSANFLTIMPASSRGYSEIMRYGEKIEDTWTVVANGRVFDGVFSVGDVFWIDGEKPNFFIDKKYGFGSSANAVVKSVQYDNLCIRIALERNTLQVKG